MAFLSADQPIHPPILCSQRPRTGAVRGSPRAREPAGGASRSRGAPNSPGSREGELAVTLAGVTSVSSVLERRAIGAVAQRERITLAVWGSRVRIPPAPRLVSSGVVPRKSPSVPLPTSFGAGRRAFVCHGASDEA